MLNNLRLACGLFFILFVFICSISAQDLEKTSNFDKRKAFSKQENRTIAGKQSSLSAGEFFADKTNSFSDNSSKNGNYGDESQPASEKWQLLRGEKQLNVELGYSPFQPTFLSGRKEYDTSGRSFGMINLRWARVVGTVKGVTYEYQAEITPVALAFNNEVANPAFQSAQTTPNVAPTKRQTTYGFGFSPIGFRFIFLPKKRLKPFAAAHAGFMFFRKPVPLPDTLDYDFTGDVGGGVQYQIKRNKALSFGYKYFHISNMNIGKTNPGYNANVFYVGYSFFYK